MLALVIEKPGYGYELHQRLERLGGELLSISVSSSKVYEVLARLEKDEYVEVAGRSGSPGKPRINFKATAKGVEANRSWLSAHMREDARSFEFLSRLAVTSLRQVDSMLRLVDLFMEECSQEAREIAMPAHGEDLVGELFIEQRRRVVAAQLEWGAYARGKLLERARHGGIGR